MNKKLKILVVEKNKGNADYLKLLLSGHGFLVICADTWESAELELSKGHGADLLLVDAAMAGGKAFSDSMPAARIMSVHHVIFLFDDDSEIPAVSNLHGKTLYCGFISRKSGPNHIIATLNTAFRFIRSFYEAQTKKQELEAMYEEMEAANEELAASQKHIEDSERKFRAVFENAPYPISISVIEDGTFIEVNKRFVENVGLPREQIIGKTTANVIKLVNPGDADLMLKELSEKGSITGFQLQTENFHGKRLHDLLFIYMLEINGAMCAVSMMTDISSLKATEQKLIEKERLLAEANSMLRTVIDTIPGYLYWKDQDLKFTGANRRLLEEAGLSSPGEITGLKEKDMPWYNVKPGMEDEDLQVVKSGKPVTDSLMRISMESGELRWFKKNKIPLKNDENETIGLLCAYEDITRQKINEDDLNESRAQIKGVFDASMIGLALLRERKFISINNALCRTLGYSEEEMLNHDTTMIYPDMLEFERVGKELYSKLKQYGQAEVEARMVTKDGRLLETLISASPVDPENPEGDICAALNDITVLKHAEYEAREKEERLRAIAFNVPGIIYQFYAGDDGTYGITFMSDKAPLMFGINAPVERFFAEFAARVHKDDRQRLFDSIKNSVVLLHQWEFEGRLVKDSGEVIWFRGMSSPSRQKDRTVFNGVLIDITQNKIAEDELRLREIRFRSIIQSVSDMIFILDANNILTYESPAVARLLGYEEGYFVGREPFQLVHPDDFNTIMNGMSIVHAKKGVGAAVEFRFKKRDGTWVNLEALASNLIDNPAVNGIVIAARDITERKKAGEILRMSEEKFRNIFENMSVGYFRSALDGGILDANPACLRIFGFESVDDAKAVLKNRTSNIYADRNDWRRIRDTVMAEPDPPVFTARLKRKNGTDFMAELKMKIVTTTDGKQMNVEGLIEDISERLKTQDILIQSEKMMTVAGLAAGMAHEINNPLGIIMQNAENAMHRLMDELPGNLQAAESAGIDFKKLGEYIEKRKIDRYLVSIREAGLRAAKIVGNMLQFSRGIDSRYDYLNINTILEKTLDLAVNDYDITKNYDFKKVRIVKKFGIIPDVKCTEIQVEQVFLNILKNAAQAMSEKKYQGSEAPEIIISTELKDDSVRVIFSDNGPGMDEATLKKIFEPFYTTKQPGSGTGLGLSVSYYIIVTGHGGTITADSTPGKGSSFVITFPAGEERI